MKIYCAPWSLMLPKWNINFQTINTKTEEEIKEIILSLNWGWKCDYQYLGIWEPDVFTKMLNEDPYATDFNPQRYWLRMF